MVVVDGEDSGDAVVVGGGINATMWCVVVMGGICLEYRGEGRYKQPGGGEERELGNFDFEILQTLSLP